MALKIRHIDANSVKGVLDDAYPFEVVVEGETIIARISDWTREMAGRSAGGVSGMRCLAYEALAKYRQSSKPLPA